MDEETSTLLELTDRIMRLFCVSSDEARRAILDSLDEQVAIGKSLQDRVYNGEK
jgi:hypothetical protein